MTERPILFSAPMVRAILAGTKTQTRRAVKGMALDWLRPDGFTPEFTAAPENGLCPYGKPGDRLWVRETWAPQVDCELSAQRWTRGINCSGPKPIVHFAADDGQSVKPWVTKWRPSIHMPRWACRLELEVTGVRVERLQAISEADALAEGISSVRSQSWDRQHFPEWRFLFDEAVQAGTKPPIGPSPAQAFEKLWASINGPDSWAANPWVWVVEFKRAA